MDATDSKSCPVASLQVETSRPVTRECNILLFGLQSARHSSGSRKTHCCFTGPWVTNRSDPLL